MSGDLLPDWPLLSLLAGNMAWASLFALVVLAIRRPFARAFGAGPTYALWLLPAVRLVLPPLPAMPSLWPSLSDAIPPQTILLSVEDAAAPLPLENGPGQWVPILLALWALGAAALICWQMLAYRHFLSRLAGDARDAGAHDGLPLIVSEAADGPLAVGLIDRRIVVPADFFTRYAPQERDLALAHEAIHHRRGDLWWNHAAMLILAAAWFNPVAWIAFRAFRADQELSCDAAVLTRASAEARPVLLGAYAHALVKSASRPGLIAACPLNHADQLKRRLRMMKDHRRSVARRLGGAGAIALLAGIGVIAGAPVLAEKLAVQETPPPAPPEPPATDDSARPERREQRIMIRETRDGEARRGEGAAHDRERRSERVTIIERHRRDGAGAQDNLSARRDPELDRRVEQCRGGTAFNADEAQGNRRVRIHICNEGGTPVQNVEALQQARDRLASDDHMSAETRQRILAQLDAAIARARAQ